jgi:cytoskeleton protein RodZ
MASFGARLKGEREKRGITLDEISLSTKIGTRFLRALEDEDFDQLPGGIFNKGFVRGYARHVGLDESRTIADYLEAIGENQPPPIPENPANGAGSKSEPQKAEGPLPQAAMAAAEHKPPGFEIKTLEREPGRIPWGTLAVVLLVIAFGLAVWGFHSRDVSPSHPETVSAHQPEPSAPAPVTPAKQDSSDQLLPDHRTVPQITPKAAPAPDPGSTAPPRTEAAPVATVRPPAASVKADSVVRTLNASAAEGISVRVRARRECWLSINADGKQSEANMVEGDEKILGAQNQLTIKAGDVQGVDFWFNGKRLSVRGKRNERKTLVFSPQGFQVEPPSL